MTQTKKADLPGSAKAKRTNKVYPPAAVRSSRLPKFPETVKRGWVVRHDASGDEYIVLNGKSSLGRSSPKHPCLDHIYMISADRAGIWLYSTRIYSTVQSLLKQIAGSRIEMLGNEEAVLSVPTARIDDLCRAAMARARRPVGEKQRERLQQISPFVKMKELLTKQAVSLPRKGQTGKGAH